MKLKYSIIGVIAIIGAFLAFGMNNKKKIQVLGGGATSIYPLLFSLSNKYGEISHTNSKGKKYLVKINYQPLGSAAGITNLKNGNLMFAASDYPVKGKYANNVIEFPVKHIAVVIAYNIPNANKEPLHLTGKLLAKIFSGQIKYWDNPKIKTLNPHLNLSHKKISIVHRADASGVTFIFSKYLSGQSKYWSDKFSYAPVINWKSGISAKGNAGVASYVKMNKYSIGYVTYDYVIGGKTKLATLYNNNQMVKPTPKFFKMAVNSNKSLHQSNNKIILDTTFNQGWPIMSSVYLIIPNDKSMSYSYIESLRFMNWFKNKFSLEDKLGFISVNKQIRNRISNIIEKKLKTSN